MPFFHVSLCLSLLAITPSRQSATRLTNVAGRTRRRCHFPHPPPPPPHLQASSRVRSTIDHDQNQSIRSSTRFLPCLSRTSRWERDTHRSKEGRTSHKTRRRNDDTWRRNANTPIGSQGGSLREIRGRDAGRELGFEAGYRWFSESSSDL